ncbi:MAG: phosphoribosylanthranilate isomerase [Ignavibacteria bacterium]|nr:phosphoribosylanthranilate isomerase [Ignavibacteria bacterium]
MSAWPRVRIKICCIQSIEEAQIAITSGASALGLVSKMPSGPGVITNDAIRTIASAIPPGVATFLLTSSQEAAEIVRQQRTFCVNTLQLVDSVSLDTYKTLRAELPGISLVQVIHVAGGQSIHEAVEVSRFVDALLLDSGNPKAQIKMLGGTGRTHDWNISRSIRAAVKIPVFLAGGLNPENVRSAIEQVAPFAVDVCSGVRTNGQLDKDKVRRFIQNATG